MTVTFRNASAGTGVSGPAIGVNKPTGVIDGDVMLTSVVNEGANTNPTLPSGFTPLFGYNDSNAGYLLGYRIALSEPGSYGFGVTGRSAAVITAYSGCDPTTPINTWKQQQQSLPGQTAFPSITPSVINTMLVGLTCFATNTASGFTVAAAGMTQRVKQEITGIGFGCCWSGELVYAPAAPTGDIAVTITGPTVWDGPFALIALQVPLPAIPTSTAGHFIGGRA